MRGRWCVSGSEDTRDSEPPSWIDQAREITDDLTRILLAGVQAAACLETDGVDSHHYSAHLLLAWYAAAEPSPAELQDLLDRVAVAGVDRDKAHLPGLLQAFIDQVNRVHLGRSLELCAVGGQQAHGARAEHRNGVSGPHVRQFRGMPSSHPRVSDEDEIILMLVAAVSGQNDAVGVRERHPEQLSLRAPERPHPRHCVRTANVPGLYAQARRAISASAVVTHPAVKVSRQYHAVTRLDASHGRTDDFDDPHALVAQHHAGRCAGTALVHVQVSTAQRAGRDPHHSIVIPLDPRVIDIIDSHITGCLEHHSPHRGLAPIPRLIRLASPRPLTVVITTQIASRQCPKPTTRRIPSRPALHQPLPDREAPGAAWVPAARVAHPRA
jgi:hypothetical protein